MPNLLETHGAKPQKENKFVPLLIDKTFTGLFTQRAALHDPSDISTKFYAGGRPDSLWMGSNIELTNRLTLQRRPGLSPFSTVTYPTAPDSSFSFELTNGTIQVIIDTTTTGNIALSSVSASAGVLVLSSVAAASAGSTVYTGSTPNGTGNAYAGEYFVVAGFVNSVNNGIFICTASSSTTLTLSNPNGAAESNPGTASGCANYTYTTAQPNSAANAYVGMVFQITGFQVLGNNGTFVCVASTSTGLSLENFAAGAETDPANAISSGAVYVDNQNGTKTVLFGKAPGAGQTYFVAVAGVLYMGDGVDTNKYTPLNPNGTVWKWGIAAPGKQPSVNVVESGSASVLWQANTVWSTMGLVYDMTSGTMLQLHSVNASGANTTQFGMTGPGVPPGGWNTSFNGTTTDGSVTWQNDGVVTSWSPNTAFASVFAAYNQLPEVIYDPVTKSIYVNVSTLSFSNFTGYYTGSQVPNFKAGNGQTTPDNQCLWQYVGTPGTLPTWKTNHVYPTFLVTRGNPPSGNYQAATITEPISLKYGLQPTQIVYWQVVKTNGTSNATGVAPFGSTIIPSGQIIGDNGDSLWLSLGSGTWAASTQYSGWTASGSVFSAIVDSNSNPNFQVCTTTGESGVVEPGTVYTLTAAANHVGPNTTYTGTFSPQPPNGSTVVIAGFTNAANNGTFHVVSSTPTTIVVNNPGGIAESHAATATFNPWGTAYGAATMDGTAVWTCVGQSMNWVANTIWYLPSIGFYPPQTGGASSAAYGGVKFIIN